MLDRKPRVWAKSCPYARRKEIIKPEMANKRMKAIRFSIIKLPGRVIKNPVNFFYGYSKDIPPLSCWLTPGNKL